MFYLWLLWVRFQSWAELQLCFCPKLYGNICQTHWKKAKNLGLNSKYVAVLIEGKYKFRVHRKHIWKNFLVDVTIGHKKLAGKFFSKPWGIKFTLYSERGTYSKRLLWYISQYVTHFFLIKKYFSIVDIAATEWMNALLGM